MRLKSAVLVCTISFAAALHAQEIDDPLALGFKARGDKAISNADYSAAADAYTRGNEIQHHPVFDYNLARAFQGLGRYADALDALERFQSEASPELRARVSDLDALIRELRANVGFLVLEGAPVKGRLRGNRNDWGAYEPGKRIRCNAGSLDLEIVAKGFEPIEQKVTITSGATETVHITFKAVDERATLLIATSASGTRINIDGQNVGQSPLETKLEAGTHHLRLEHPDYEVLSTDVVVAAREHRKLDYNLPQRPGIWSRWWLWTGAAAVVAGVVVTGFVLSSSKSATPGNIQPGVVSAPILVPR